jgi:prepilin-type N-terminal cleavage/methylation domain-containing protein
VSNANAAASGRGGSEARVTNERRTPRRNDNGFTLIEMMIAAAIFSIVAAVVFIFYTAAQKSYKAGENFTDQQQATRVAFDRMLSDIRLAGFNTNPDGDSSRVDEQVEGAWDTAVTIRGDFDFEDPTASTTPETTLKGAVYNVVSTGNDEIVTYALAKPGNSGPTGPDTLTLTLDPDKPRSKSVKTVTIPNVVLVQNNPPYTLYRITLADVTGSFPSSPQASTNFIYEPVADNIRTMTFQYWPDSGAQLGPNTPASSGDDIGGADTASVTRSKIRKITVALVGMTPNPDMDYVDASDASATTHYRKFDLQSEVNPENLGRTGIKDIDITPPPAPTNVALVPGHCQGILAKWDTPSSSSGVTNYMIKYWPNGSPGSYSTTAVTYPHSEYGVIDYLGHGFVSGLTQGTSYCMQVQARDLVGNQSGWSPSSTPPCATVTEASTPGTPTGLSATGNGVAAALDSQIKLSWTEVKSNANTVTGDPNLISGNTILRDPKGYKLYKDVVSTFTPNDATNLVAGPPTLGNGVLSYTDTAVANCQTYYYKAVTTDTCNVSSAASATATGQAQTNIAPAKPLGLSTLRPSRLVVNLTWTPVTTKVDGTTEYVNLYKIWRAKEPVGMLPAAIPAGDYTLVGTSPTAAYTDNLTNQDAANLNNNFALFYVVSAGDLCGNESVRSDAAQIFCSFSGTVSVSPTNGSSNSGSVPIVLNVSGTDTYVRAKVQIPNISGTGDAYNQETFAYPFSFPAWNSSASGAGVYTINWEVENSHGCVFTLTTTFTVVANLACQITPTNPNLSPTAGNKSNQDKNLSWDIMNNSGKDLSITSINVTWSNNTGTHLLQTIQYPTGTTVTSFGAGAATPASANYSFFPLLLSKTADGSCGSCKVNVMLGYDTKLVNATGAGELITIRYNFQDATAVTGYCQFSVFPDLSIVTGP